MNQILHQAKKRKDQKDTLSLSLENANHLGSEKLRVFKLLGNLASEATFFEKYLVGTTTLLNNAEKSFIETRSDELLIWLLEKFSISHKETLFSSNCTLHTFNHIITFPFKTKEVLSFFIEVKSHFLDLESVKKMLLENYNNIAFVDGSFILIFNQKATKIYLEIQKEDIFSEKEIANFRKTLPKIIEEFIKKPKIQFIVPSNRELLIKSFQWIIKDLNPGDIPHVFIDFTKQTANTFQFSALVCSTRNHTEASIQEKLNHPDISIEGTSSHAEKNYLKEGVVSTIEIAADPTLSIIDARKKCYLFIQSLIGSFRDINGGLLEKIEQNFNLLCKEIKAPVEDLQYFFYGITPQEKQATASISLLKKIYASMKQKNLDNEIDYFVKEDKNSLCITIKTTHMELEKEFKHLLLSKFPDLIIANTYANGISTISCALQKYELIETEQLKTIAFSFYKHWQKKKELKQVLRLGCTTSFPSFDPRIGTEEEPSCLLKMLFEGLTKIGTNGVPEKALAKKIEILDYGLVYRFHLKKSYWSNKTPVTAYDFAYSWETSLKPDFSSPLSYLFYPIKNAQLVKEGKLPTSELGIKVINDFILEVELQHPTPYFLELCAHSAFSPVYKSLDIDNPSWPKSLGKSYICNGPFIIDSVNSDETILKKNSLFWEKKRIKLERVIISNMSEKESQHLFQNRKLDALLYPFCENKTLKSQHLFSIQKKKCAPEVRYLTFNCSKPPFSNRKMRQAFSLALQRKILASSFSNHDESLPHYSPYSPEFTQLNLSTCKEENYSIAKKLFFESLEEDGLNPDIFDQEKIYANTLSRGVEIIIAQQLNKVFGLNLCSVTLDRISLFSLIREKRINIYIYSWINRIQDPSYFLNTFSSKENIINFSCWDCKKINYLNQSIQKTNCTKIRNELHFKAEELLHKEKPVIPLFSDSACSLIQSDINNIYVGNSQEFDIRYCYKK